MAPYAVAQACITTLTAIGSIGVALVLITSKATLASADTLAVTVTPSSATKCERCWHWRDDVGADAAHPAICGRCVSNLHGAGEVRTVA